MSPISLFYLIEFIILGVIFFLSYRLSTKKKYFLGYIFVIIFTIGTIFSLIIKSMFNAFVTHGYASPLINLLFTKFPLHFDIIPVFISGALWFSVLSLFWGAFLIINSNRKISFIKENESSLENHTILINNYIDTNTQNSLIQIDGEDFAHQLNSLNSLFKLNLIDEKDFELKKIQLTFSLVTQYITSTPEEFIIAIKSTLKNNILSNDDLKEIFQICNLKENLKNRSDEELILNISSDIEQKESVFNSNKTELTYRGYPSNIIDSIINLKNLDNLKLFKAFSKSRLEYLNFKLSSRNIDASLLLEIMPVLNLSEEEILKRYLENSTFLMLNYRKTLENSSLKRTRFKKWVSTKSLIFFSALIIIIVIIFFTVFFSTPSTSNAINYIKKIKPTATNIEVRFANYTSLSTSTSSKSNFLMNINYDIKENDKEFNIIGNLYFNRNFLKWIPISFSQSTSQQIPLAGLDNEKLKFLMNNAIVEGIKLNTTYITLSNIQTYLNKSSITSDFTYKDPSIPTLHSITGQATFAYVNGNWSFNGVVLPKITFNLPQLSTEQLIDIFKTSNNSPISNDENPGVKISIVANNVNMTLQQGSANCSFEVMITNGNTSTSEIYNCTFQYLLVPPSGFNQNFTKPGWYLISANTVY